MPRPSSSMATPDDQRVPLQQAQSFVTKATATGAIAQLIVKPDAAHGWPDQIKNDVPALADWFNLYLRGIRK